MPKINVYLPNDLAAAVRAASIPVSPICQKALADAVRSANRVRDVIESLRDPQLDESRLADIARNAEDRMTQRLRGAIELGLAGRAPGEQAGTGRLLLGMLDDGQSMAATILQALDVDLDELRATVERVSASRPEASPAGAASQAGGGDSLLRWLTMPARNALADAIEASIGLGHNYLGSEHLLLGLLTEPSSVAGSALGEHQVRAADARRMLRAAVAGYSHGRQASSPPEADSHEVLSRRLDAIERRLAAWST